MKKKQEIVYWWLPLLILCLIAYYLQINIFIYKDVSILSHTAALMLEGQTYAHDIFEPNPPIIFYLHIPPIILAKLTGIKIIYCLRLYLIALILLCVVCSHFLFTKLFKQVSMLNYLMSYALAFILLFLPAEQFGQREHFLLILTIPYLLLAAYRLDGGTVKTSFAVLIGIMAGIGFSIKPFFLPTLLLIELFFIYRKKSIFGWFRVESTIAALIILFYGLAVIFFFPDYWQIVLPLWMPYYKGIVQPWGGVLSSPLFLLSCVAMVSSWFVKPCDPYKGIKIIFSLALLGYLITFLIPRVDWYYHIIPALSIACLYFVLIFGELLDKTTKSSTPIVEMALIGILALMVFSMPILNGVTLTSRSIVYAHSDSPFKKLITFLNQHGPNNSYDFFSMTHLLYNLEFYSTSSYVGSFPFCGWEYNRSSLKNHSMAYQREMLPYILNILSHDLDDKKPRFVIIDIPSSENYLNNRIDYPKKYSQNKNFKEAWSHYAYSTSIGPYEIYERQPA